MFGSGILALRDFLGLYMKDAGMFLGHFSS